MGHFTVNAGVAIIFKRILESWNPAKNAKRFAKMRRRKYARPPFTMPALTMTGDPTGFTFRLHRNERSGPSRQRGA
jgi:hypothetical protein